MDSTQHHILSITRFWVVNVARLTLAATLIFSGFVKAVDPMGMFYKLSAYFAHWGVSFAEDSLLLRMMVVVLATVEFVLGIYWLLGSRLRLTTRLTTLLMVAMTLLTVYIYLYEPVPDCGCFGDAYILTNGMTLAKNVVLVALCLLCLRYRHYMKRIISERNQWLTSMFSLLYIVVLSLVSLHYLPQIDFTDYRNGTNWRDAWEGRFSENAPEIISTLYLSEWRTGDDVTEEALGSGYRFLLTIPDIATADVGNADRINDIYDECVDHGYQFYCLVGEPCERHDIEQWIDCTGAAYPIVLTDAVQLRAMVRSNPGLLLLKDAVQVRKWSGNNLPVLTADDEWKHPEVVRGWYRSPLGRLVLWFIVPLLFIIMADRLWIGSKFYRRYLNRKRIRRGTSADSMANETQTPDISPEKQP